MSTTLNLLGIFPFNEDVILQSILSCLGPRSLLRTVCINSVFERLSSDDLLWLPFVHKLWDNKSIVCIGIVKVPTSRTFPYHKIVLDADGYKTLKSKELKYILQQRKVDTRGCSEKQEFIALALDSSSLILGQGVAPIPRALRDKWKASFYVSLHDGHRTQAVKEDICTYKWAMTFKSNANSPDWEASFHPDFSMESIPDPQPGVDMTWCFHGANDAYIRVGQYPPLIISRLPDWGWVSSFCLLNVWVLICQTTNIVFFCHMFDVCHTKQKRMENQHVFFIRTNQKI